MKRTVRVTYEAAVVVVLGLAASIAHGGIAGTGELDPADLSAWTSSTAAYVGKTGVGAVTVNGGSELLWGYGRLGYRSGSNGTVTISGAGSAWTSSGSIVVGWSGYGRADISGGASVSGRSLSIGSYSGGQGAVRISGAGSTWTNTDSLSAGWGGDGRLDILDGAVVTNRYHGYLGQEAGSSGAIAVSGPGSIWTNTGDVAVGYQGDGVLNVSNGAVVSNTDATIAYDSRSTSAVTVSGAGSTWINSNEIIVGSHGDATLDIAAGGVVSSSGVSIIGWYEESASAVSVSGAGSTWTNTGDLMVGNAGHATLDISDGGLVEVSGVTQVSTSITSNSSLNFNNGTLTTGGFLGAPTGVGTINVNTLVSDADIVFDSAHGLKQTFNLNGLGSNIVVNIDAGGSSPMGAGYAGSGSLRISDGLTIGSDDGYLGYRPGSIGVATVSGAGSTWTNSRYLNIGYYGDGSLDISDGAVVSNASYGYVANKKDSTGRVTVSGAGSTWTIARMLYVGYWGDGSLVISDGGRVLVESSHTGHNSYIGYTKYSTSSAEVSGDGSTWVVPGGLYVGYSGNGTLDITGGGIVTSRGGSLAGNKDGVGVATISGAGSVWSNTGVFHIGRSGDGTLNLADGGLLEVSEDMFLAESNVGPVSVNFNNGAITTGGFLGAANDLSGVGTINTKGLVTDAELIFNSTRGLTQTVTLDGPGRAITVNLDVDGSAPMGAGYGGAGSMSVSDGLVVRSTSGRVGYHTDSDGMASVSGPGSSWILSKNLIMGYRGGFGELEVTNGGVVESGGCTLGRFEGSSGAVTVSGDGSILTSSGSVVVGNQGHGVMVVTNGGIVTSESGNIAVEDNTTGSVTVSGPGSAWIISARFDIGGEGAAMLDIRDGGTVSSGSANIGYSTPSSGVVKVDGPGSTWTNNGMYITRGSVEITNGASVSNSLCYLGYSRTAASVTVSGAGSTWTHERDLWVGYYFDSDSTLDITGGAKVSNANSYVGHYYSSTGVVTVNDTGSIWTNSGDLYVGEEGYGLLSIARGGLVSVGGKLIIDEDGDGDSFINMSTKGRLAIFGQAGDLSRFLDLVSGTDAIRYWDDSASDWADIAHAMPGMDYTLSYLTDGDLAGYTVLTVPEPATLSLLALGGLAVLRRRNRGRRRLVRRKRGACK